MGANATQAQAFLLFLIAFVLLAAGLAVSGHLLLLFIGAALAAASFGTFLKCKPWEHREE